MQSKTGFPSSHQLKSYGASKSRLKLAARAVLSANAGLLVWLRYCTVVAQRRSTKLCTMFGHLLGWYTIYTFSEAPAPNGILPGANSLCVQVLRSPIFAALLHGTRVVGVSQTLRRSAEGVTNIWQGGHHVGHRPRF